MISEPAIDKRTEEKMFFGTLDPEDAPPELARVAVLLRAAARPRTDPVAGSLITDTEKLRQHHVVAAMAAALAAAPEGIPAARGHSFWKAMSAVRPGAVWKPRRGRARLVLVMALGLMVVSASMAFAGVLPSPVQHAASVLLGKVGVHVPEGTHGSGKEPGSSSGHEKVTGSGDHGNGKDHGKHSGQEKNGNRGKHTGQDKGGHEGDHGHDGDGGHEGDGHDGHDGSGHDGHDGGSGHDGSHEGSGGDGDSHGGSDSGHDGGGGDGGDGGHSGSGHDGGGDTGHQILTPSSV